ncbi:maltoporin/sucrose porin [Hydrogenispora ethanolica]|uniref:Maltoporin/sucrose porin n=1 Tax=Hydrogenispora ethanolica TaxID=1082276 RepID=A0A4R1R8Q7_HYDET|nr:carbohydrate porin [Hydrogenispora ethanolica]TCL62055.1 maltoporin/sucrose porin [Hydrogenispora ethanolica]
MKKFSLLLAVWMVLLFGLPALAGTSVNGSDVTFTFKAPDATAVYLSGSFNSWNPAGQKMSKGADGVWSVTIPLKPGTYQYKFVVDGTWTPDPDATSTVDDGYGGKNAVLLVREKSAAAAGADDARLSKVEADIAAIKAADQGFSFHGYARTGILVDDDKEHQTGSFQVNGAWAKYRLGNEPDTFIENTLEKKWRLDNGSYALVHFLYCHQSITNGGGWQAPIQADGDSDTSFFMRESYAEIGNLPELGNLTFWAGQRYYRRDDIHIIDWYWRDFTGVGAGVQGIKVGDYQLDLAYMAHSGYRNNDPNSNELLDNSLIFTLSGVKAGPGSFDFDLVASSEKDNSAAGKDGDGLIFTGKYSIGSFFGLTEGSSMVGLYYGKGLATYGLDAVNPPDNNKNAKLTKLVTSGVSQITEKFEIQPVLVYLKQENEDWNLDQTWKSIGCRPVYHFTKNFALQFEAGYDQVETKNQNDVSGSKLTIAPTITLDTGFYARPQLRVFASRFNPDQGDSYMTYGVQMEVWW